MGKMEGSDKINVRHVTKVRNLLDSMYYVLR